MASNIDPLLGDAHLDLTQGLEAGGGRVEEFWVWLGSCGKGSLLFMARDAVGMVEWQGAGSGCGLYGLKTSRSSAW